MAGFLKALKLVPWNKVVVAAPVLASEARMFWARRVNGRRPDLDEQVYRLRKQLTAASLPSSTGCSLMPSGSPSPGRGCWSWSRRCWPLR